MTTGPQGLTSAQVAEKIAAGKVNKLPKRVTTKTVPRIILESTLTIFNLVNAILAFMIIAVGSYKNLLFILLAIANTTISIVNEIRAKRTIDKLKLQSEQDPTVIRDGKPIQIPASKIVEGDLLVLRLGDQILVDSQVSTGQVEVNESYISGEQENIAKHPGDKLISGSFIVSGSCTAEVQNVGTDNFLVKLESSAKSIKPSKSQIFTVTNNIVKYVSFALIPIGVLLLLSRFRVPDTTPEIAVTSTVAALINVIPEGLVLLTSGVLALATIRLAKQKVLVQDLYSIETLARVDTICLDKTGTLTTGKMHVKSLVPSDNHDQNALESALKAILSRSGADNATSTALKEKLLKTAKYEPTEEIIDFIPFSSDRKYSGVKTKNGEILMGALEFITEDPKLRQEASELLARSLSDDDDKLAALDPDSRAVPVSGHKVVYPDAAATVKSPTSHPGDYRIISVVKKTSAGSKAPQETLLGLAILEDELRPDAAEIIRYFAENDVDVKIISGDNLETVKTIAEKVGLSVSDGPNSSSQALATNSAANATNVALSKSFSSTASDASLNSTGTHAPLAAIDLSAPNRPSYQTLVRDYQIFTRVTPNQKKSLVKALRAQGHVVAMTGDGVNDILAMKEADCSIAIGEGADAARRAARLVLLDSDFSAVPSIIAEGRRSINNLERSTTLFLTKTIYAGILAVVFAIAPLEYPYSPIEMSFLNTLCIGLPGFALALESNVERVKDRFVENLKKYALPTGLAIAATMIVLAVLDRLIHLSRPDLLTFSMVATFVISLSLIYRISKPLNSFRAGLIAVIIIVFVLTLLCPPLRHLLIM